VEAEWGELREWVEDLVTRYPHLDHHPIPACWYRHNGHVEVSFANHTASSLSVFGPPGTFLRFLARSCGFGVAGACRR
jgi:hypothetical protein